MSKMEELQKMSRQELKDTLQSAECLIHEVELVVEEVSSELTRRNLEEAPQQIFIHQ